MSNIKKEPTRPFVIYALPRSRTAWVSHWLSYGPRWVGHDIGAECHSVEDFFVPFEHGMLGTAETGAMLAWQVIKDKIRPRMAVIRRPVWQVLHSLSRFGFPPEAMVEEMLRRDRLLDEISEDPETLSVQFDELSQPEVAKRLWQHCLGIPFDGQWFKLENGLNIQVDMAQRLQRLGQNAIPLAKLKASLMAGGGPECLGSC